MSPRAGFSMIELIMVIVVIAIAAVGIGASFAHVSRSLALNEDLQRASQVAQECAEHILSRARPPRGHYAAIVAAPLPPPPPPLSTECNGLSAPGFNRQVYVTAMAAAGPLCGAGWGCKRVQVMVTKGSAVVDVNFMIIQY
jgi:prepilin-type N-terminal cleavage/methylation domain-containing protein